MIVHKRGKWFHYIDGLLTKVSIRPPLQEQEPSPPPVVDQVEQKKPRAAKSGKSKTAHTG